jgi:DNA-binding response OmpR family regulator
MTFMLSFWNESEESCVSCCGVKPGGTNILEKQPAILVVEDDEEIQILLEDALGEGGFEPAVTASGEEAVTLLNGNRGKYAALVADVALKGRMTGWEVATKARQLDPGFPVLYVTGAYANQWPLRGVPHSALLQKPFASAQLVTAISELLNTPKQ